VHFTAFCLGGPFFPGHGVILSRGSKSGASLLFNLVSVSFSF